jgi:deoxyhypusine synthase
VDIVQEQMVFSEATIALPLIAGYVYGKKNWCDRAPRQLAQVFNKPFVPNFSSIPTPVSV